MSRLSLNLLIFGVFVIPAAAQQALQQQIRSIASDAHGKVSVACSLPGTPLNCELDPDSHPPMQSVFKLPLGLTILHQVEQGKFRLDQAVPFQKSDLILPKPYSPLQDKYPDAGVNVSLRDLLQMTVSLSDNTAADILLRLAGGPKVVGDYMASLGVTGFELQDDERALHRDHALQYRNWFEPRGAVQLLRTIADHSPLTAEHTALLLEWMSASSGHLGADLPNGTKVAHKTGQSGVDNGVAAATNDTGLITLPDGRQLAVAVFVTDSTADEATRYKVIARISRAIYDYATQHWMPTPLGAAEQTSPPLVLGIDHIPVVVTNLEKAQADFRAMGFAIKPGRFHADGILNAHVKFPDGSEIELITAPKAVDELTSEYRTKMESGEGPVYFGLYATDPGVVLARLHALHIGAEEDDGMLTFPSTNPLHPLFLGNRNKSPTDKPEHFAHQNGAVRLSALWVRDTPELRELLKGLGVPLTPAGRCGVIGATQAIRAGLPEGNLYLVASDTANVVAARVEVRRLSEVEAVLKTNGVPMKRDTDCYDDALWIPPSRAHGIWIEFAGPRVAEAAEISSQ